MNWLTFINISASTKPIYENANVDHALGFSSRC